MAIPSSSPFFRHDDTWIDYALDYLREHRLHPAVEVVSAWIFVAPFCLSTYALSWITTSSKTPTPTAVPLMTYHPCGDDDDIDNAEWFGRLERIENDTELVDIVRNDELLRRQVSQFMQRMKSCCNKYPVPQQEMFHRLENVWIDLLRLPSVQEEEQQQQPDSDYPYKISLIILAYKEAENVVTDTLSWAFCHCCNPQDVQVIVIVSSTDQWVISKRPMVEGWGSFQTVVYSGDAGRGPCHNAGAQHATGRLLTFLHSDTVIAPHWDVRVHAALLDTVSTDGVVQACAFTFGHNIENLRGKPYPWGIQAVRILGNLRANMLRLPYGDHIISIPSTTFRYVGGFPHQPIMEDYDLIDLFRKRAKILKIGEYFNILPPPGGKCSVRRWQQFGVIYVTLVNALMVYRYVHGGWSAEDIFDYYYKRPTYCAQKKKQS